MQDTSDDVQSRIVIDYITKNNLSFAHLNDETTHRFAAAKIKLKSDTHYRTTILDAAYAGVKEEVQKIIDDTRHVSFTTDIMSNQKGSLMA